MLTNFAPKEKPILNANIETAKPKMPVFGVAIFDNMRDPVEGWGCLPNEKAFRFRQPSDLRNDCIWICAVDGNEYRRRFAKLPHLRPADYLRSAIKAIAGDLGMHVDGEGRMGNVPTVAAPKLAMIAHQTVSMAAQAYGWPEPEAILRDDSLSEDIRRSMIVPPHLPPFLRAPLMSAYQSYSSPDWVTSSFESDSITVNLRFNRLAYAKKIMLTPVPDGAWNYMTPGVEPNPTSPFLVEASVEMQRVDSGISSLVAFGAQPGGQRNGLRSWMCQREHEWVSKHAKVHLGGGYCASSTTLLPERVQLPEKLTADPANELSISAGLVAEAHWTAIANPTFNSRAKSREATHWGVWLRAADRAMCFELALALHKKSFHVLGYGSGAAVVRLQRQRLPELLDFAMENNIAHPAFREIFEQNGII